MVAGMFLSVIIKDLAEEVQPTFDAVIRHYTMIAVSQQAGKNRNLFYSKYYLFYFYFTLGKRGKS
jgi:hypothetical protein